MLFHTFSSQDERRAFGGSCFIEFQFCPMPESSSMDELVSVDNIEHWRDDSLYVADENRFYEEYCGIFDSGTYNNLETGVVDIYGINYYSPALTEIVVERIKAEKPEDYEKLLHWLESIKEHNGFYILGI